LQATDDCVSLLDAKGKKYYYALIKKNTREYGIINADEINQFTKHKLKTYIDFKQVDPFVQLLQNRHLFKQIDPTNLAAYYLKKPI
jgi:tRNA A37 threonylcarbamoyladenosine modification protein TsaB